MSPATNCLLCNQNFKDQSKLDFHLKTAHLNMLVCSRCPGFATFIQNRLDRHQLVEHNIVRANSDKSELVQFRSNRNGQDRSCSNTNEQDQTRPNKNGQDKSRSNKNQNDDEITIISDEEDDILLNDLQNTSKMDTTYSKIDKNNSKMDKSQSETDKNHPEMDKNHHPEETTQKKQQNFVARSFLTFQNSTQVKKDENIETERFECDECWFTSLTKSEYFDHLQIEHKYSKENLPTITTSTDTNTFKYPKGFSIAKVPNAQVMCGLCTFETGDVTDMEKHLGPGYHFSPRSRTVCQSCPFWPESLEEVLEHGKSHLPGFALFNYN